MFIKIHNRCYRIHTDVLIKAEKFIICTSILFIISYAELILSESLLYWKLTVITCQNITFDVIKFPKFSLIWVYVTLVKLYTCNNKTHKRKSKVLNFFYKLKFDEKADIAMHCRSTQCFSNLPRSYTSTGKSGENIYVGQQQQNR